MFSTIKDLGSKATKAVMDKPNSQIGSAVLGILALAGAGLIWYTSSLKVEDVIDVVSDEEEIHDNTDQEPIEVDAEVIDVES